MSNIIEFTILGIDKFSGSMNKVGKTLVTTAKAVAVVGTAMVASAAAVAGFVNKFTQGEDRVAKFAKRLKQSVEEISSIEFAAERSGIAIGEVDMAMQRLQRRAEEAAQGMGEAQGAFREMGIDAEAFIKLPMSERLAQIADSIEGMEDQTRIAFKLFDSGGVSMLQMLGEGSEAYNKLIEDASKFGRVVTAQQAANAEAFQDSWTNLTSSVTGVFRGISDELAPLMTGLLTRLSEAFANSRGAIVTFVNNFVTGFFTIAAVVENVFNAIGEFLTNFFTKAGFEQNLKTMRETFVNSFKFVAEYLFTVWPQIGKFILDIFVVAFEGIREVGVWAWENLKAVFTDAEGPSIGELLFDRIPEATAKARQELEASTVQMAGTVAEAWTTMGVEISEAFNITTEGINKTVEAMMEKYMIFGEVMKETNESVLENTTDFLAEFGELWNEYMEERGTDFEFMMESMLNTVTKAIDAVSQGIANAIVEGKSLMVVMKNIVKQVLKEIIAALIKLAIQKVVTATINAGAAKTEAIANASEGLSSTFIGQFAAMSSAPYPVNLSAGAVAASMTAAAAGGYSAAAATGAGLGAAVVAHGGMTHVPKEQTYFLDEGERVLSPKQNTDFTDFLQKYNVEDKGVGTAGGSSVVIENLQIDVLPNATSAQALLDMDPKDMEEIVAEQIIDALEALDAKGIRPVLGAS